mmetsp:Transcript_14324/g.37093  ORF Transcript_14324/g.37093 Transcript_14324/m.37093 type:complete len:275 (+) Transcript_14324:500-1324(+)
MVSFLPTGISRRVTGTPKTVATSRLAKPRPVVRTANMKAAPRPNQTMESVMPIMRSVSAQLSFPRRTSSTQRTPTWSIRPTEMTPMRAATGIFSIWVEASATQAASDTAHASPDRRPRPPVLALIADCPMMAHPPIAPKKPQTRLPAPWAMHSMWVGLRIRWMSSTRYSDSIALTRWMAAMATANGATTCTVSMVSGTSGTWNVGSPPPMAAMSPTVCVWMPRPCTSAVTAPMATSCPGTARVIDLGVAAMMATVMATRASMMHSGAADAQSFH